MRVGTIAKKGRIKFCHFHKNRNRRRRYGLRCNLLAAIYNYELILPEAKFQTITIT